MNPNLACSIDRGCWSRRALLSARDGRVRVAVIVGGAFQGVSRWPEVTGCHLNFYVDVPAELKAAEPSPDVVQVTLAAGQTTGTLVKVRCPPALKRYLDNHPGVNLEVGLAQLREIGKLAVKALLADPTFQRFICTHILDQLLILTNGSLVEVELIAFTSGAGGTGGPVAIVLLSAIAQEIENRSEAIVAVRNIRAGSLSYVGLGDRVHSNAAATLAEDLHWILALPRHEREVRGLYLAELPMVQGDKEARSAFATQFVQALSCRSVRDQLDRVAPNLATQTELGTVTLFNVNYWNPISPRRIAEDASSAYAPQLEAVRSTPPRPARLQQIRPVPTFAKSDAKTVEDRMAEVKNSKGVRPENFVEECLKATEVFTGGTVTVTFSQAESFELSGDMLAFLRKPVLSQAEWTKKFETIRTTLIGLANEITAREPEVLKLDKKLQQAARGLNQALDLQYPKGPIKRAQAFWYAPQTKLVDLQNAITKCRELSLQKLKLISEKELLASASARLQDVLDDEERRLEGVLNLLRPYQRSAGIRGQRFTESVPLDGMMPRLLALAEQSKSTAEVLRTLASCVTRVTLAGLAEIVGAKEPQPGSIAQRLLGSDAPVQGPRWGGRIPLARGTIIKVLPPVEESILEAIRAHAPMLDGTTIVTTSDTAQAGANVVELEVQNPRELSEVVTKFVKAALQDASATPELHADEKEVYLDWALGRLAAPATPA